jgi:hypothetical protein
VTAKLVGTLRTVMADWDALGTGSKLAQIGCAPGWNIAFLRDELWKILPPGCGGPPASGCDGTVRVCGGCYQAGTVNYMLWGVIEFLVGEIETEAVSTYVGTVLHLAYWGAKKAVGTATFGHFLGASFAVGYEEGMWVEIGKEFARAERASPGLGGLKEMNILVPRLPTAKSGCVGCSQPPRPLVWRYTWWPYLTDRPSRF